MPTKFTRPQMDDAMLERCMEAIPALCANPTRCPWCGLPLADSKCNACFPPSQPSREFLISQAVLCAVEAQMPLTVANKGVVEALKIAEPIWTTTLAATVRTFFRAL